MGIGEARADGIFSRILFCSAFSSSKAHHVLAKIKVICLVDITNITNITHRICCYTMGGRKHKYILCISLANIYLPQDHKTLANS